ncbi:MAG: putative zinc transporter msc2 [Geoglossum simile]|nr:MAG: putative zinc transporter msc2 [Geoglossum simile]
MASAYALPIAHHGHSHSHSHSPIRSIESVGPSSHAGANTRQLRKEASTDNIRAHGHSHSHPFDYHGNGGSDSACRQHVSNSQLRQKYSSSELSPNDRVMSTTVHPETPAALAYPSSNSYVFPPILGRIGAGNAMDGLHRDLRRRPWLSAPEALTSILIPFPFLLTTLAFSSHSSEMQPPVANESAISRLMRFIADDGPLLSHPAKVLYPSPGFVEACALTSATLLLTGSLAKICSLDRRKDVLRTSGGHEKRPLAIMSVAGVEGILRRALSVGLPFYAGLKLGGDRAAIILLTVLSGFISEPDISLTNVTGLEGWKKLLSTRKYICCVLALGVTCDVLGYTMNAGFTSIVLGYLALFVSAVFLPLPLPGFVSSASLITPYIPSTPSTSSVPLGPASPSGMPWVASPLISTKEHVNATLASGVILLIISFFGFSLSFNAHLETSLLHWMLFLVAAGAAAAMLTLSQPSSLQTDKKAGFILSLLFTSTLSIVSLGESWVEGAAQTLLGVLSYLALRIDLASPPNAHSHLRHHHHQHQQQHEHQHGAINGPHHHSHRNHSIATKYLLQMTQHWPLAHNILAEKDSRRIFYFMVLNFTFMLVQTFYGIATGSLGLLSDSIHMLFDCLALLVGLCAAVMSKWPPSMRFPYGLGKMDTLAGFANGIFLMLISIEIVIEAIERLVEGSEVRRIGELLTVSSLGLGVNLVGLFAFDHAHHGHGHSHGAHSHGIAHHHSFDHEHSHDHSHNHGHGATHSHSHKSEYHTHEPSHGSEGYLSNYKSASVVSVAPQNVTHAAVHGHGHHHHSNENMHGIFLHVLADTLGSVAVVVSTLLIKYFGWVGFDPLASCLIAILIFASAIPLVSSSAKTLLLAIPADTEYKLRETLTGVSGLRGVAGYCVPKFWLEDATGAADTHSSSCDGASGAAGGARILGVIHVIISKSADVKETESRIVAHLSNSGLNVVVQVEREGEGRCWCGGGGSKIGG